jgi:hypothetical protein
MMNVSRPLLLLMVSGEQLAKACTHSRASLCSVHAEVALLFITEASLILVSLCMVEVHSNCVGLQLVCMQQQVSMRS